MHTLRSRLLLRHSLPWLVWLAMLLPMAQMAAAAHAVSHGATSQTEPANDKQSPHALQCDLCLTAAGVTGGVLPSHPLSAPGTSAGHAPPAVAAVSVWLSLPALAYLSRAPPLLRNDR